MPKVIDNYVLEDKIGSGQFGDVYKGFNQQNHMQVAIKTIKRQTIKGKFYQLLQNQIKVLKTCDNPYIMKLYALKKTANHYYLVLQYCNGGDMLGKIKKYKRIQENQVIKYFCQILTGFQTLVKHKIMHRDFKLANILLHDDNIKIADFGFSKLLNTEDYTSTMLGSPLNMAPQVLGGNQYNNKADIWSIGACIYQMLFGKPPYMANNMVDLLKNINTKTLQFPSDIKINSVLMDVIKRMLTADVKKRISWNDLFSHPINRYLDSLIRKQIDLELIQDESLMINTSKYYLKKNLVVTKPQDIQQKAKMNDQLIQIIKTGQKSKLHEKNQQKPAQQSPKKNFNKQKSTNKIQEKHIKAQNNQQKTQHNQSQCISKNRSNNKNKQISQNFSHIYRQNSKNILHYRNMYAFLASVVDQVVQISEQGSQLAAYVIIKKILKMINWLDEVLQAQKCPEKFSFDRWQQYQNQQQYSQVKQYIKKQLNVFTVFSKSLQSTLKQKVIKGQLGKQARQLLSNQKPPNQSSLAGSTQTPQQQTNFKTFICNYIKPFIRKVTHQTLCTKDYTFCLKQWGHILNVLICLNYQQEFKIKQNDKINHTTFDFNKFYEDKTIMSPEQTLLKIESILSKKGIK